MVTIIEFTAKFDDMQRVVNVDGQCFAREGVPAAGNKVYVRSAWGETKWTTSSGDGGKFHVPLSAAPSAVGQEVTCESDSAKKVHQVTLKSA